MKALEYPKGRAADGFRDLLKSRLNSKGQVVLREQEVEQLLEEREFLLKQSRALSKLPFEVTKDIYKEMAQ